MPIQEENPVIIAVVGPCGSGKSTLVNGLSASGIAAHHVAQEHSFVPNMWLRLTNPDYLIFLDASFELCTARKGLNWSLSDFKEQHRRLAHAREHADLYIFTDHLSPSQLLRHTLDHIQIGQ